MSARVPSHLPGSSQPPKDSSPPAPTLPAEAPWGLRPCPGIPTPLPSCSPLPGWGRPRGGLWVGRGEVAAPYWGHYYAPPPRNGASGCTTRGGPDSLRQPPKQPASLGGQGIRLRPGIQTPSQNIFPPRHSKSCLGPQILAGRIFHLTGEYASFGSIWPTYVKVGHLTFQHSTNPNLSTNENSFS